MKLTLTTLITFVSIVCAIAQDVSPALVFKRDRAMPVVAHTVWKDASLEIGGLTPSLDALIGYDPAPASEQMVIGYALVLERPLTSSTSLFGGVAYLAPVGEVRFTDLWDRLGIVAGVRIKL